ncbi:GNAT family N-acetyltransferase [Flectobacillus roseus]|uniref:GNAT family N-acetyltransferase n=1 Tax=Flectobacillus roseus TaxID=502259 RepID=A0ABT6Y4B0_9BACT|nr:GNAT family N-acetyltransferase [Flectobacillus roseus]MDI9858404.1 GNAT family N-acetyltransferase [Flectobacillus roseus]
MQNSINLKIATIEDIPLIQSIAEQTWRPTYGDILTEEQTLFMLDMMYSSESLTRQFEKNTFIVAYEGDTPLGFAGFEPKDDGVMKLHKLYMLPAAQGKGIGKLLIQEVAKYAEQQGLKYVYLNVNRNNKAIGFYEKQGFKIIKEEDINIGNDYWMNDYVMQLDV